LNTGKKGKKGEESLLIT